MVMQRRENRPLVFPIGDKDYEVPPVGIDAGIKLAQAFEVGTKSKLSAIEGFKLAMTPQLWQRMRDDGVGLTDAWRAGVASMAFYQVLLADSSPAAIDDAHRAAEAIWESGIDPKALESWLATNAGMGSTNRATRRAAANTTRTSKSGTGTRKSPAKKTAAARSRGR